MHKGIIKWMRRTKMRKNRAPSMLLYLNMVCVLCFSLHSGVILHLYVSIGTPKPIWRQERGFKGKTGTMHHYLYYKRKLFICYSIMRGLNETSSIFPAMQPTTTASRAMNCTSFHFKWLTSSPVLHALGHYANASSPRQQTLLPPACNQTRLCTVAFKRFPSK